MSRLSASLDAETEKPQVVIPGFVEMEVFNTVTQTAEYIRAWTGPHPINWNGFTWTAVGQLLEVSNPQETVDMKTTGLRVRLSGIPNDQINIAETYEYQGRPFTFWMAFMEPESWTLIDVPVLLFRGVTDFMVWTVGEESFEIAATVEHAMARGRIARNRRYTPEDQARDYPTDKGFDLIKTFQEAEIIWGRDK